MVASSWPTKGELAKRSHQSRQANRERIQLSNIELRQVAMESSTRGDVSPGLAPDNGKTPADEACGGGGGAQRSCAGLDHDSALEA